MTGPVYHCPSCRQPFRVPADGHEMLLMCPHCSTQVDIRELASPAEKSPPPRTGSTAEPTKPLVIACPQCRGRFKLASSMPGEWVACPHCETPLQVDSAGGVAGSGVDSPTSSPTPIAGDAAAGAPQIEIESTPPSRQPPRHRHKDPTQSISASKSRQTLSPANVSTPSTEVGPVEHELDPALARLLPPKFVVDGSIPSVLGSATGSRVVLPDASGGFRSVDTTVRTVRVGQQAIAIQNLSPKTRRRRRLIRTGITFFICAVLLFAVLRVLLG
jgi:uncharacterized protein YbaR (Trm112 family)